MSVLSVYCGCLLHDYCLQLRLLKDWGLLSVLSTLPCPSLEPADSLVVSDRVKGFELCLFL